MIYFPDTNINLAKCIWVKIANAFFLVMTSTSLFGQPLNLIPKNRLGTLMVLYGKDVISLVMKTEKYMLLIAEELHGVPIPIIR